MTEGDYVLVWLDEKIGCGYRGMIVLSIGRKWIRLFYPPQAAVVRVPIDARLKFKPLKIRKGVLSRIIREAPGESTEARREALALIAGRRKAPLETGAATS